MIEQLAVVVYGVLTLIAAIILAGMQHSVLGMVLVFTACGVTYSFQFIQLLRESSWMSTKFEGLLIALVFILTIASVIVSTAGY